MSEEIRDIGFYFMTATSGSYARLEKRAGLKGIKNLVNLALFYYEIYAQGLSSKENILVMIDPKGEEAFALNDDPTEHHHIADPLLVRVENDNLETLAARFIITSASEMLTRSFVLLEKILDAQDSGWAIGTYNDAENEVDLIAYRFQPSPGSEKLLMPPFSVRLN